jgi:hypothetical protein
MAFYLSALHPIHVRITAKERENKIRIEKSRQEAMCSVVCGRVGAAVGGVGEHACGLFAVVMLASAG